MIVFVRGGGANLHRFAAAGHRRRAGARLDPRSGRACCRPCRTRIATQGNLDPLALVAGGAAAGAGASITSWHAVRGRPHIFNLGHGILPETPIAHVAQLIARVRGA